MTIKYLLDENMSVLYRQQLLRYKPDLEVRAIGDEGVPSLSTPDPLILIWCEEKNFILVTNNRRSMPIHLADHLQLGHHIPAIFVLRRPVNIGRVIEDLILIAELAYDYEYQDRITYIPLV